MALPKRPGVFVTESLLPLVGNEQAAGRSTAVFVGVNKAGGPVEPTLVESWQQFFLTYGGFGDTSDLLPFAVYQFFANGGSSAYVIRAANADAVTAFKAFKDSQADPADALTVTAKAPGSYANNIKVSISAGSSTDYVTVSITNSATGQTEVFNDVTLNPADSRNLLAIVNGGSNLVTVSSAVTGAWDTKKNPTLISDVNLAGGSDGTGTPDLVAATKQLETKSGIFDINLPGVNDAATINALAIWAEGRGNAFIVVDGVAGLPSDTSAANASAQKDLAVGAGGLTASSVVAVYGPWLQASDPLSSVGGSTRLLPPGGFVLGQYARTDVSRGVQKVAAGVHNSLRGILGPQFVYAPSDLDDLNQAGVNVIRPIPGYGTCIFGGRTLAKGMPDRYINIRRSLITLKDGIISTTRFAVFEENDESLRSQITDLVEQYLRNQWAAGVLSGATQEQAFFVVCDDTNNTPTSISNGQVNVQVGVALKSPAEFIVFTIGQTLGGVTSITESA